MIKFEEKPIYFKSLKKDNFRHGKENPKVIGFVMITPVYLPRQCFKVEYESDGKIDYIEIQEYLDGRWEMFSKQ